MRKRIVAFIGELDVPKGELCLLTPRRSADSEIKGLLSDFKKSIKTCDPWDREIEFQRNK